MKKQKQLMELDKKIKGELRKVGKILENTKRGDVIRNYRFCKLNDKQALWLSYNV